MIYNTRMVMRLVTRIVCVIVGVLLMVFGGPWSQSLSAIQKLPDPAAVTSIAVGMIPFYIGIALVILGILSIRKWKKENN